MKIFILTPWRDRLEPRMVESVREAIVNSPCRVDWFLVRGNPTPFETTHPVQVKKLEIQDQVANLNRGVNLFLGSGYPYLLIIESDIIVPKDLLHRLMSRRADVITGLARLRQEPHRLNCMWGETPVAVTDRCEAIDKFGLACLLLRRRVIEQTMFKVDYELGPDFRFAKDCVEAGFSCMCDTAVKCKHILADGTVLEV